jgi:DUF4097 and DUF4098 domain-containing protein YvlB
MAPRVVFTPKTDACLQKLERLNQLTINGQHINITHTSSGDVRLDIKITNQATIEILDGNQTLEPSRVGIENIHLQDASGSYAYHIPEGNPTALQSQIRAINLIAIKDGKPSAS